MGFWHSDAGEPLKRGEDVYKLWRHPEPIPMPINIEAVKKAISENLDGVRTVSDVARISGASLETLRKDFVRQERITLSEYLTRVRVERAKDLLCTTDESCKKICWSVGFSREEVGARVFKRYTRVTMEGFRRNSRNKTK